MSGTRFELELFEQLNEEYRAKPILGAVPTRTPEERKRMARRRVKKLKSLIEIEGSRVVEIGCGHGFLTRALVRAGGAREALGLDVVERDEWQLPHGKKVKFMLGDLAGEELIGAGIVDSVVSFAALEHVRRPALMLEAIQRILRPGGRAYLKFNLHRGPIASHNYDEVFFGWPHLLFDPMVCRAFFRKHHDRDRSYGWVNELTAPQYVDICREVGLRIDGLERQTRDWDVPLYTRFIERLGRYPALDLETDFLTLVLEKPGRRWRRRGTGSVDPLPYVERQHDLDRLVAALD